MLGSMTAPSRYKDGEILGICGQPESSRVLRLDVGGNINRNEVRHYKEEIKST